MAMLVTTLIAGTAFTGAVSERQSKPSVRVLEEVNPKWGLASPAARVAPAATIAGQEPSAVHKVTRREGRAAASETCPDNRKGLAFYRQRHADWLELRGAEPRHRNQRAPRKPRNCADARYLAGVWKTRAFYSRVRYEEWKARFMLRDYPFGPGHDAWPKAVKEVQRVFPGTESWLLSCSDAEGWSPGFDKWVGFGGVPYSPWLRDSNTVGGPMQFRFGTFTGMFRRGADFARSQGFHLPSPLRDRTTAWRSALGQAIAAGWARYTGNDDSHWSASWGNGC